MSDLIGRTAEITNPESPHHGAVVFVAAILSDDRVLVVPKDSTSINFSETELSIHDLRVVIE